jgi:hypothetical protein
MAKPARYERFEKRLLRGYFPAFVLASLFLLYGSLPQPAMASTQPKGPCTLADCLDPIGYPVLSVINGSAATAKWQLLLSQRYFFNSTVPLPSSLGINNSYGEVRVLNETSPYNSITYDNPFVMPNPGQSINVNVTLLNLPSGNYSAWISLFGNSGASYAGGYLLSVWMVVVYFTLSYLGQVVVYNEHEGCVPFSISTGIMSLVGNSIVSTANSSSVVSGQPIVSQTYFDNFNLSCISRFPVYMWVIVMNSTSGQTEGVFADSAVATNQHNLSMSAVLFNLPPGTYRAVDFLTTQGGEVTSPSMSVSFQVQ